MKKSHLSSLFDEESSSSDKSLLTYRPQQLGTALADAPSRPSGVPPASSSAKRPTEESNGAPPEDWPEHGAPAAADSSGAPPSVAAAGAGSPPGAGAPPELLYSCAVPHVFTFPGGGHTQSVSLGALGCAVYWEPARGRSLLVLYRSRQQQVALLTLTPRSLPAVQPRLYVSFRCDAGRQYSAHLASPAALHQLAMKVVLAAALAGAAGGQTVALLMPQEDGTSAPGGRRARDGDQLSLRVSEWTVEEPRSQPLRQPRAAADASGPLAAGTWRSALVGALPGQRWLLAEPGCPRALREVLVAEVRPPPRQPPLLLPADDDPDWTPQQQEEHEERDRLSPESPPSPPSSPSLPAANGEGATSGQQSEGREEAAGTGRADVLARMARLGHQMFPLPSASHHRSPSPPPSPPPSPSRCSPVPAAQSAQSPSDLPAAVRSPSGRPAVAVRPPSERPAVAVRPPAAASGELVRRPAAASAELVRPPAAASAELGALLGRLEVRLETVLSRLEPRAADTGADAETLAVGVRRLGSENAALRAAAERAGEQRLASERARAALAAELADTTAQLADTRRELAEARRRLSDAERADTQAASHTADAARESRRALKALYRTLVARLPAEETFTGAAAAQVVAEAVREALHRAEAAAGPRVDHTYARGEQTSGAPPAVTEEECGERGDE